MPRKRVVKKQNESQREPPRTNAGHQVSRQVEFFWIALLMIALVAALVERGARRTPDGAETLRAETSSLGPFESKPLHQAVPAPKAFPVKLEIE